MEASILEQTMKNSTDDFWTFVKPKLQNLLGKEFKFIPIEASTRNNQPDVFDLSGGVDVWLKESNKAKLIYGVANRVQWGPKPYDTFTIRYRLPSGGLTEYQKRLEAIESGAIYPKFTVQSYISSDRKELYSCAIVLTKDLIYFVRDALEKMKEIHAEIVDVTGDCEFHTIRINEMGLWVNFRDGNQFAAVPWTELEKAGIWLKVWQNKILKPTETADKASVKNISALRGITPTLSLDSFQ